MHHTDSVAVFEAEVVIAEHTDILAAGVGVEGRYLVKWRDLELESVLAGVEAPGESVGFEDSVALRLRAFVVRDRLAR